MNRLYIFWVSILLLLSSCSKEFLNICDEKSSAYKPLKASFSYSINGMAVTFTNKSEDAESYLWDFGDGTTSTLQTPPQKTFTTAKTHSIKLTTKRCGGEKTSIYTQDIKIDCSTQSPSISRVNNNESTICQGKNTSLTASSCTNGTLLWSTGATTSAISVSNTGTYSAQCIASCPSNKSNELTVTVNPVPAPPTITAVLNQCINEIFPLTATGCVPSGTLKWFIGSSATTPTQSINSSKTYTASCTANGCESDKSASKTINVIPLAEVSTEKPTVNTVALVRYDITFRGAIDFNTTTIINGDVEEHGFIWAFGSNSLPTISENTTTPNSTINANINGVVNLGPKPQANLALLPFSHLLSNQVSKTFKYQAYIKRCNGTIKYGSIITN